MSKPQYTVQVTGDKVEVVEWVGEEPKRYGNIADKSWNAYKSDYLQYQQRLANATRYATTPSDRDYWLARQGEVFGEECFEVSLGCYRTHEYTKLGEPCLCGGKQCIRIACREYAFRPKTAHEKLFGYDTPLGGFNEAYNYKAEIQRLQGLIDEKDLIISSLDKGQLDKAFANLQQKLDNTTAIPRKEDDVDLWGELIGVVQDWNDNLPKYTPQDLFIEYLNDNYSLTKKK